MNGQQTRLAAQSQVLRQAPGPGLRRDDGCEDTSFRRKPESIAGDTQLMVV